MRSSIGGRAHPIPTPTLANSLAVAAAAIVVVIVIGSRVLTGETPPGVAPTSLHSSAATDQLGSTWSSAVASTQFAQAGPVSFVAHAGRFYALGHSAGGRWAIWSSDDGLTWTAVPPIDVVFGSSVPALAVSDLGFVVVGEVPGPSSETGVAVFSTDGVHWTQSLLPAGLTNRGYAATAVVSGRDGFVALGLYHEPVPEPSPSGDARPLLWHSLDGIAWQLADLPRSDVRVVSVAAGADAYLAGGCITSGGTCDGAVWRSTDGASWDQSGALPDNFEPPDQGSLAVDHIVVGERGLLAISGRADHGVAGRVWGSANGSSWGVASRLTTVDPRILYAVPVHDGFIAAGLLGEDPINESLQARRTVDGSTWITTLSEPSSPARPRGLAATTTRALLVSGDDGGTLRLHVSQ